MAANDPPDPRGDTTGADDGATRYRSPAADPDATGYHKPTGDTDDHATRYREAGADPAATGYPTAAATVRRGGRKALPCRFGDYELLEEIDRGGMGVVYKARQQVGGGERLVALKMIEAGRLASHESVERFLREARAAAALDHPGIVPLYDIGRADDRHYFTMQLMGGGNLADRVREGPLEPRVAARLVRQVAEAVQFAHERGIIHRDLKPANILLANALSGGSGAASTGVPVASSPVSSGSGSPVSVEGLVPKVTDFGLARTGESGLSVTGEALGTPSYMPPEQARGQLREMGPASDVYGLGAVLYCLVTGRPPFQAANHVETMRQVCDEEPVPPRQVNPGVPKDLETVCLKCLQKEPVRRYASAAALAEELGRFERGEPVQARPVGRLERCWRWCRRNPSLAALTAGAAALLVVAAVSAGVAAVVFNDKAKAEARARAVLEEQQYDNYIAVAERELTLNQDVSLAGTLLEKCPEHLRGWEWDYLMRLRDGSRLPLGSSPALGPRAAVKGMPGGHKAGVWMAAFSPNGRRVATCSIDGTVKIWDTASGRVLRTYTGHAVLPIAITGIPPIPVLCLAFSPDGRHIASGSFSPKIGKLRDSPGVVRIWDVETGKDVVEFRSPVQVGPVLTLAYSPDGRRIASASSNDDNSFVVWDAQTAAVVRVVRGHTNNVFRLRFSPNGRILVSGSADGSVKLWDAATLEEIRTIAAHPAPVLDVAFAPGGARFATGGQDGTVRLWETATGAAALEPMVGHSGSALGVAFSPDGKRLASAGYDKTVRVWDPASGKLKITLRGHTDMVWSVAFNSDGRQLLSGSFDSTARIWDATPRQESSSGAGLFTVAGHKDRVNTVAFSPEGRYLASGSWDHTVRLWNAQTGEALHTLQGHTGSIWCVSFCRDGTRLASAGWDKTVRVWDTATGRELVTFTGHKGLVQCVAFSPDGTRVASGGMDSSLLIWDPRTGNVMARCEQGLFPISSVAFSPDGKRIASGSIDRTITLWDVATGKDLFTLKGHAGAIPSLSFSPDGKRLVTASWDYTCKIWDVDPARRGPLFGSRELLTLVGHNDQVNSVAFSPDGTRIASAGEDKTLRIWDAKTGKEIMSPRLHRGIVWSVSFSHDGKRVAAGSWARGGWVKTWDAGGRVP